MRLFQVLDAQGRLCPGALTGGRADVATAGQAGFASTLDLLTAADQDGLDLAGWFEEQRRGGVTVPVDWAALEKTGKAGGGDVGTSAGEGAGAESALRVENLEQSHVNPSA